MTSATDIKPTAAERKHERSLMLTLRVILVIWALCAVAVVAGVITWVLGGFGTVPAALIVGAIATYIFSRFLSAAVVTSLQDFRDKVDRRIAFAKLAAAKSEAKTNA